MEGKKVKKHSIVVRIFFLLMVVICLQALFSLNTILFTDIVTTVESYTYNAFTRTVNNRKRNLESFMSASWSNISEISATIGEQYDNYVGENDTLTEKEKVTFLNEAAEEVIHMITMTGTTGGFLILDDGEDMEFSYSCVYLKSYDNASQVVNRDNLMLARGPAEVSKEQNFSLVTNWSYGLTLTEDNIDILRTPMEGAKYTKSLEYLGYWHISTDIANENLKVITCSMPVLDKNGEAIGVVGVELSQEYFYKFLPENEFADEGSYGYILVDVGDDSMKPTLFHGTVQSNFLTIGEEISLESLGVENEMLEGETYIMHLEGMDVCVYYGYLDIYVNNSPFHDKKIWLAGLVDSENMTSFTDEFWSLVVVMLIVSLSAGVVFSYLVGRRVANPILKLSKVVSSYDVSRKIHFEETSIKEIDELASVISQMQENILRSASRTDKILELLNIGVGSFEYVKGTESVAISEAVYKMLDIPNIQGESVEKSLFFQKLEVLKDKPIEEIPNAYAITLGKTHYYKVEEFQQEDVILGVIEDVTKEVEDLMVLNYERNYDVLTGIFNRRAFHQKVTEVLKYQELKTAGFVMFDLDNLKYVNDTFGHDSGDVYIKTAATTIYSSLQKVAVVGRMSGDEFYAFLYGFDSKEEIMSTLNALYARFDREPIEMPNSLEFKIRVSGGIAWYGEDSTDLEELKKFADFAMYKGKHTLKGELRQFDKQQYLEESFMLNGKAELNKILENDLLNFVFQPIINVQTGEIFGYEALMRPVSDILSTPLKLLQLASLEGKLWKVEKIALFKTLSLYQTHKELFQNAKLFINSIPSENLKDEEYQELKNLYGDVLSQIVIEITEQEQADDSFIEQKLEKLHYLQLDIALDDYGSGYANDMGLIKMKPDIVKIDRSLISNVHVDPSRQSIIQKIIDFCKQEDICVLGEGIETEQELEYLVGAGIELAQGYYISRPMELPPFHTADIKEKMSEINKKFEKENLS